MSIFTKLAQQIFASADEAGNPRAISEQETGVWGTELERLVGLFVSSGGLIYPSLTALNADLAHAANSMAWVLGDAVAANNGVYGKVGASGVGSWTRRGDLPFSFIIAVDAGAGTPDAIQATSVIPISASALVWMNIADTNTSSPVTVSFNGGSILTIKTNSGNNPAAGGLVSGMIVLGIISGSTFRLLNDQVSSAIVAAAEAAQAAAEAAAASVNIRNVADRTALKALNTASTTLAFLMEGGRYGSFGWKTGDYSAQVAADTNEGIYVKASAVAATSGAWVRQFNGPWNASWFGLSPSASAAVNVTAFNAMLTLAVLADTVISFDPGTYSLNAKITKSTSNFLLLSSPSIDTVFLTWSNSSGGLDLTYTDVGKAASCERLNLVTTFVGGGTALKITGPDVAFTRERGSYVIDVDARGSDPTTNYWTTGIHLVLVWHASVQRPDIKGKDNVTTGALVNGVLFEDCMAPEISTPVIYHAEYPIRMSGTTKGEGLSAHGGELVGGQNGVWFDITTYKPQIGIHDMHINAAKNCVRLVNVGQINVHDLSLYKTDPSAEAFRAIEATNSYGIKIHDNTIACPSVAAGTGDGIVLDGCDGSEVHSNLAEIWFGAGALVRLLGAASQGNTIRDNKVGRLATSLVPVVVDAAVAGNNVIHDNGSLTRQVMTTGTASPSVLNDLNGEWSLTNPGAQSITVYGGGYDGQRIRVYFGNGNTTLTHNSQLILKGSVNQLVPNGGIMTFRYELGATLWREEGRNF